MLTSEEMKRLNDAISVTVALPVVGSIEDYAWEAIFHYVKNIKLQDPVDGRTKQLHDVVDPKTKKGWSLKTLQINRLRSSFKAGLNFEYIIQRADVFDKAKALGFPSLAETSSPSLIGKAVIKHWNQKINMDQLSQEVTSSYEGILLKTKDGLKYLYLEYQIDFLNPSDFTWAWTDSGRSLQGTKHGRVYLKWYKNQKQLFKIRSIPTDSREIVVSRTRLELNNFIAELNCIIQSKQSEEGKSSPVFTQEPLLLDKKVED